MIDRHTLLFKSLHAQCSGPSLARSISPKTSLIFSPYHLSISRNADLSENLALKSMSFSSTRNTQRCLAFTKRWSCPTWKKPPQLSPRENFSAPMRKVGVFLVMFQGVGTLAVDLQLEHVTVRWHDSSKSSVTIWHNENRGCLLLLPSLRW